MLNSCVFMGRLVKDVELIERGDTKVANFTLAVDRTKNKDKEKRADFIPCEVWGKQAEALKEYSGKKGQRVVVKAEYRTENYDVEGVKKYKNYFYVDKIDFIDWTKEDIDSDNPQYK